MRFLLALVISTLVLVGMAAPARAGNYLKNADLKEGSQMWRGDGQAAFLKPDGTEGQEGDPGAIPVMRVALARGGWRMVFQEFDVHDAPSHYHVSVQVYASVDFKRSGHAEDYQNDDYIPNGDFVVRLMPDYSDQMTTLKPGEWVTAKSTVTPYQAADSRAVYFFIPPGEGVVYLKNPSVTP